MILALSGSFHETQICLHNSTEAILTQKINGKTASSQLIPTINEMLVSIGKTQKEVKTIAIDSGPGAFTSVRIVVVTANAIAFASDAQIISFSGLYELTNEIITAHGKKFDYIAVMLNAYSREVYACLWNCQTQKFELKNQCLNIEAFLVNLKEKAKNNTILFGGNGTKLYQPEISQYFAKENIQVATGFDQISAETLALKAAEIIQAGENTRLQRKVPPFYIKPEMKSV